MIVQGAFVMPSTEDLEPMPARGVDRPALRDVRFRALAPLPPKPPLTPLALRAQSETD